ncbi:hypothetical protein CI109_107204 [Kwoniella shandongensis]|uniref:Core domain-containing protein n=1 Tax=Kwoniella shandongensis TaxID=1734106 RepID=A0A5M6C1Z3_9TREE|nr:uncharacterized protein CI109_002487 [Kwoniella shandongensis]KAA5529146.1 hypothetical protein CI109_002487 [Kwoniella shandongensis]
MSKLATTSRALVSRPTFASSSRLRLPPPPPAASRSVSFVASRRSRHRPSAIVSSSGWKRSATTSALSGSTSNAGDIPPSLISQRPNIRVSPPSLDAIKEEGYLDDDVKLLPTEEAFLNITPEAVQQLAAITTREPPEVLAQGKLALRVGVESGGCHGYQYTMALTEERGADDYVLQPEGLSCIPVVVDLVSFGLLKGATLHHATELIGSSFRLQDNPQAKEGGACGCGVSWEAKA